MYVIVPEFMNSKQATNGPFALIKIFQTGTEERSNEQQYISKSSFVISTLIIFIGKINFNFKNFRKQIFQFQTGSTIQFEFCEKTNFVISTERMSKCWITSFVLSCNGFCILFECCRFISKHSFPREHDNCTEMKPDISCNLYYTI